MSGSPAVRGGRGSSDPASRSTLRPGLGDRRGRPLSTRRQQAVVLGALVVVATELAGLAGWLPTPTLGDLPLSLAVVPAAVVATCLGRAVWGRASQPNVVGPLWVTIAFGLAISTVVFARSGDQVDLISIMLAAGTEELVYRFSIPVVIVAVLLRLRVPDGPARLLGYAAGAVWFVLLPGHTAQASGFVELLPFIAFAALAAMVVARSGALVAVAGTHTVINLLTVAAAAGQISDLARMIAVGIVLILLVAAYGRPVSTGRRPAEPGVPAQAAGATGDGGDAVIDLTDSAASPERDEPTIDLTDGVQEPEHAGDDRAGADRRR